MAKTEKIQSILHSKCRMTSTFASGPVTDTSFLLLLCELFTSVTVISPLPPPRVSSLEFARPAMRLHSPHSRCSVCQWGFVMLPPRSSLPVPSCAFVFHRLHLAATADVPTGGGWRAPLQPAPWLSIQEAFRSPETMGSTYPSPLIHCLLPPAQEGQRMRWCGPAQEQAGYSLHKQQGNR